MPRRSPEVRELLAEQVGHSACGPPCRRPRRPRLSPRCPYWPRIPGDGDALRLVGQQLEDTVGEAEQRVRRLPVARLALREGRRRRGTRGRRRRRGRAPSCRSSRRSSRVYAWPMQRVPFLSGTRIAVVDVAADGVVLRPPAPDAIADVGAAVREALRFPLTGASLERLVTRGRGATVVIEPPHLPIPSASADPRQEAIAAVGVRADAPRRHARDDRRRHRVRHARSAPSSAHFGGVSADR